MLDRPGLWSDLAAGVGLAPDAPLVLALSGGADSVFLLHALARAPSRPLAAAVHVDHGLRGAESDADREFSAELCGQLGVPFVARRVELGAPRGSLEAAARRARYAALRDACAELGCPTLATAHHRDDALETLCLRWLRGTELAGLPGLRARRTLGRDAIDLVRPLHRLGGDELRASLRAHGLEWREDSTNASPRFARNRVRHGFLPWVERAAGPLGLATLRDLEAALAELDRRAAAQAPELASDTIPRAMLGELSPFVRRRLLWRRACERTGRAPTRQSLDAIERALTDAADARVDLRAGWSAALDARALTLIPPTARARDPRTIALCVPDAVPLGDGRVLSAEWCEWTAGNALPREADTALLDARAHAPVSVRWPRTGDRFRGLGAPGARSLRRFLRDAGVPEQERGSVPLVLIGNEIAWVAGVRPSHAHRVRGDTRRCLRVSLSAPAGDPTAEHG